MTRAWLPLLSLLALLASGCLAAQEPEPTGATAQAATVCGKTSVQGVDVSHYDGTIDWTQAKASGIAFAFVKASEGTTFVDPTFATNWAGMKSAGIVRGAYHFFDANVDPTQQADQFLSTVGALEDGDLPLVHDFEQGGSTLADATTFLAAVTKASGKTAMIYMSPAFLSSYAGLGTYPLWVANWGVTCPDVPAPWSSWAFWQTSSTGTVAGISGASSVDLDTFNGTLAELTGATVGGGDAGAGDAGHSSDGGASTSDGGASTSDDSGAGSVGHVGSGDAGTGSDDGVSATGVDASTDAEVALDTPAGKSSGGCDVAATGTSDRLAFGSLVAIGVALAVRRRRRA